VAEVIHVFSVPILLNGRLYRAQVCGREEGHVWFGWIEFVSEDGLDARRTRRETTQPDREALVYWATGLSVTYLEGALARALEPPVGRRVPPLAEPAFNRPAPPLQGEPVLVEHAVLDPFSVASKGKGLLRSELQALRGWHLRNIIRVYELAHPGLELESLREDQLVDIILKAVEPA
jgi:hypothetical protein